MSETSIIDANNPANGLAVNSDGSINAKSAPAAGSNQRVNAQSGDFATGAIADLATLLALAGASGDANTAASLMGRLTKLRDLLALLTYDQTTRLQSSLYGKGSGAAGDTPLLLDSSGRALVDASDRWARQLGQVDIARVLGAALSYSNPLITQDAIRAATVAGKGFHATTGLLTSGTTNFRGAQLWNPLASGVTLFVYSVLALFNSANVHTLAMLTSAASGNTGWSDAAMTRVNLSGGGAASNASVVASYSSADITTTNGSAFELFGTQNNVPIEALTNGEFIILPPGSGLAFYLKQQAANNWGCTFGWLEY